MLDWGARRQRGADGIHGAHRVGVRHGVRGVPRQQRVDREDVLRVWHVQANRAGAFTAPTRFNLRIQPLRPLTS